MLWTAIRQIIGISLERTTEAWLGGWFWDINQTLTFELELEGPLHENNFSYGKKNIKPWLASDTEKKPSGHSNSVSIFPDLCSLLLLFPVAGFILIGINSIFPILCSSWSVPK